MGASQHYAAGDSRVLKTARAPNAPEVHTAYIFPGLELRRAQFNTATAGDYTLDSATEVAYLFANGVRLARLVHQPVTSAGDGVLLRVFFELGDHLGSGSVALDKASGELVERSTYQAYGGAESSYRPSKWGDFREDYRFTGKEEDVEVGLTYFGKRFYNALLQRWVSPDPLEVHQPGQADANLYAYVSGSALKNVDPLGLEDEDATNPPTEGIANSTPATVSADGSNVEFAPDVIFAGTPAANTPAAQPVALGTNIEGVPKRAAPSSPGTGPGSGEGDSASFAPPASLPSDEDGGLGKALWFGLKAGFYQAMYDAARQESPINDGDYAALDAQKHQELLKECGSSCSVHPGARSAASAITFVALVGMAAYGRAKAGGGGAKRGPKTNPNAPHNATIRAEADKLEGHGNTIVAGGGRAKERLIPTPGGMKTGRRPDILYETPEGELRGRNVGRTTATGQPVPREVDAMSDLNGPGGLLRFPDGLEHRFRST